MIIPWAAAATMTSVGLRRQRRRSWSGWGVLSVGADGADGADGAERFSLALGDSRVQNLFKLMGDGVRQNRDTVR